MTRRVLIVEDDDEVATLMQMWIQQFYGDTATVHVEGTVADSEETLDSLPTLDVAILDRKLPDGSGSEILGAITSQFDPITMMITGSSPASEIIQLPIDDYVIKPLDEETLVKSLSLLEKLQAANALQEYADARKASLLEYHLDDPEENPLFRRFAAKWSYDHLEIAQYDGQTVVYELYVGDATDEETDGAPEGDSETHVSIAGTLDRSLQELIAAGAIDAIGELVPSREGYGWMDFEGTGTIDVSDDSIAIYRFTADTPEQYITPMDSETETTAHAELADILEREFN